MIPTRTTMRGLWEFLTGLLRFLFVQHWSITLVTVLGAAAVYLLLPRPRPYPRLWGGLVAVLAVLAAGALVLRVPAVTVEAVLFYLFAGVAVAAGGLLITQ